MPPTIFSLVISLFMVFCAHGQAPAGASTALLHINQPFYVSGEVIWYQLFLPPGMEGQVFTIRASLIDEQGQAVDDSFISSRGRPFCRGYCAIPYDLPSGLYRLWLSALNEEGVSQGLAMGAIPVYNDLLPLPAGITLAEAPEEGGPAENELQVELKLEASGPGRRQPLDLIIQVRDKAGQAVEALCSVAITDERLLGKSIPNGATRFTGPPLPPGKKYLEGINVSGSVFNDKGRPLSTPLLGALGVDQGKLLFTKSDGEGHFLLSLPEYSGKQRWQFIAYPAASLAVQWRTPAPPAAGRPLVYTQGILDYLTLSRQRKKIYQLYAALETALPAAAGPMARPDWEASINYDVQNYERFPDMATFFQEAVPAVRFLPRNEGYLASLYNPTSQDYFSAPPLFLIDGKATYDAGFAGRLDPASVLRVGLLQDPQKLRQYYPAVGAGGVIRISTRLPALSLPPEQEDDVFLLPGLQAAAEFPAIDAGSPLPALRPAIFWQSGISATAGEGATLSFRHSDDCGEFCIEVVAQSLDGRRGSGKACYTVQR